MLSYYRLLGNIHAVERVGFIKKSSSSGKIRATKIIRLNTENKYLYGSLLETQRQRRRTISRSKVLGAKLELQKDPVIDNCLKDGADNLLPEEIKKSSKQKVKKPKVVQSSAASTVSENGSLSVSLKSISPLQGCSSNIESEINKESPKRRRKIKAPEIPDKEVNTSSDEFVFRSIKSVCEKNFPLENSEKFPTHNCTIENVLSYGFSDPAVKKYIKFPSVSKVMDETMSDKHRSILNKWRSNMIKELGEEGFMKYSSDLQARGHDFHLAVRNVVLGKPTEVTSEITQNALKSLAWMLEHTSNPMAVESITAHPQLGYKGIPDCVAMFRNIPVVMDWKLSDKPKKELKDTYDAPVQVTAYIGALNHDPNYKWGVNHGLVTVAYSSGDPCDVFLLAPKHCEIYWRHWLLRLDKFKARSHLHVEHDIDEAALGFI